MDGEDCLSEASSAAQAIGTGAKPPLGATPGRQGGWVLLPKQKDRVVRGRNPASPFPLVEVYIESEDAAAL